MSSPQGTSLWQLLTKKMPMPSAQRPPSMRADPSPPAAPKPAASVPTGAKSHASSFPQLTANLSPNSPDTRAREDTSSSVRALHAPWYVHYARDPILTRTRPHCSLSASEITGMKPSSLLCLCLLMLARYKIQPDPLRRLAMAHIARPTMHTANCLPAHQTTMCRRQILGQILRLMRLLLWQPGALQSRAHHSAQALPR